LLSFYKYLEGKERIYAVPILVINQAITTMAGEFTGLIVHGRALLTAYNSGRKELNHRTQDQWL
jgi:hypothetical protein